MILGVDIGGTAAKLALIDREGHISARTQVSTCVNNYEKPILDCVSDGIADFLYETGTQPEGIGVSATGQVDDREGVVIGTNGKIPHYEGTRIKEMLEARFKLPVWVLNDANAAALGECFAGRAKGLQNVVMVTLGTGVGGGIVIDGKIYGGTCGIAGEIGHFTLYQSGVPCPCGKRGCYESYASTSALVSAAAQMLGEDGISGRGLFDRATQGDQDVLGILDRWIDDVAAGLSSLTHIFNPEMILIGGGVSAQEELLMVPLRRKVLGQVMPRFRECLQVEAAALGNDAGVIGAAAYWIGRQG